MKPLDGITVVELAGWVAAPSAGAILADLGADVIKIEPPGGDRLRGMLRPPKVTGDRAAVDYPYTVDNRGKRSIVIAVNETVGGDLVRKLVARADIFLTNMLAHRQTRYGFDPETLFAIRPDLVHASLSGYGLEGPDAATPGYDVTAFFGRAGITDTITDPESDAPSPAAGQGDHATGLAMVGSVLAALRLAEKTGAGQIVDVSLFATGVWTMASDLSAVLIDRRQPTSRARNGVVSALNNRYRCEDGHWVVLTMPEQGWWAKFCAAFELGAIEHDERFADARSRYRNMAALVEILDEVFVSRPMAEWAEVLDGAGLIWGPAARLIDVINDPQAAAVGLFPTIEHPVAGAFQTVASPISVSGAEVGPRGPAPDPGDHTDELLAELGLDPIAIAELRSAGVVS
jgi:crotonobetainyl-CoA:carnitine CoA-transferase CaiB-like acyl-CoA transferase